MPRTAHRRVSVRTAPSVRFGARAGAWRRAYARLCALGRSKPARSPRRRWAVKQKARHSAHSASARGESQSAEQRLRTPRDAHSPQVVAREEDHVKQREDGRDAVGEEEQPAVRPVLHVPAQGTAWYCRVLQGTMGY